MKRLATKTIAGAWSHTCSLTLGSAAVFMLSGVLALPVIAQQSNTQDSSTGQSSSSPQTPQSKQQNQQKPPAHKSAAQENPFPADVSKQAAQQESQPSDTPAAPDANAAQQTPQPTQKPGNAAAQENPFPEDVSKSAAAAAKDNDAAGSSSSSSSSSSNSNGGDSSSSSNPNAGGDADPNADLPRDTGRHRLKKPSESDIQTGSLAAAGKAQDDVRIGRFYLSDGNYNGAYGRFSEASRFDPTNLDAIYGLAAAAAGLHHTDEALTNYKLYLQVAPDGNDAKSARKAIRELSK
jgi:tetratricopeptide (TPR) repeat protein